MAEPQPIGAATNRAKKEGRKMKRQEDAREPLKVGALCRGTLKPVGPGFQTARLAGGASVKDILQLQLIFPPLHLPV